MGGVTDRFRRGWLLLALLLGGCADSQPGPDADVIVIGAGIAGLAAALEASDSGASVLILDRNSVGGGHAVMAGGLFLVDTPLQKAKGIEDSPELAWRDLVDWGEDPDPAWGQRYVRESRAEVHDWLVALGVEFAMLLPAPGETSVPRFHFTRGTAVNVVVPMMRALLDRPTVRLAGNHEVTGLEVMSGGHQVIARDTRTGKSIRFRAPAVVLATGGFENDLERVRKNWLPGVAAPQVLLAGASHFADGSGLELVQAAGGAVANLHRQTIFVTGFPNPRDPEGRRGLLAQNAAAIFVDASGKRFMDESAPRKALENTVLALPGQSYWMIFDDRGSRRLFVRGAPWLNRETVAAEILDNPALVSRAGDLSALAAAAGLPADALKATVQAFNTAVAAGSDDEFGRFGRGSADRSPAPIVEPPFYAMRLYPMTRKSMGGIVIDGQARILDPQGRPVPGLLAAGEATGVAGINGSHGGSGTFLGPSVLTGRIAGRGAAAATGTGRAPRTADGPSGAHDRQNAAGRPGGPDAAPAAGADLLAGLLANPREGYWHFEQAHRLVQERGEDCASCHRDGWSVGPAESPQEKRVQLESCTRCH
jgi:predicted oxidoreductase